MLSVSPEEQLFVYLLNRARNNPQQYQIDAGLTGQVDLSAVAASMPLAVNDKLFDSTEFHVNDMVANNYFAHQSPVSGLWPNKMARNAGYALPTTLPAGGNSYWILDDNSNQIESIAAGTISNTADYALKQLIVDSGENPPGHRIHLLAMDAFNQLWREVGVGYAYGAATTYGNYWAIHTGVIASSDEFLTGVVYNDANGNGKYDLNEGLSGVTVSAGSGKSVVTNAAGGWSIPITAGTYTVTTSGGAFVGTSSTSVTVGSANVEVDFLSGKSDVYVNFQKVATTAPVMLSTPAVSDSVNKGLAYRISWTGGTSSSTVQLWNYGPNGWAKIADSVPATQGYYDWDTTSSVHGWYYFTAQVNPGSGGAWYSSNSPNWVHVVNSTNHTPTVTLTTSATAQSITKGATYNITWNAADTDGDTLHVQLWAYSADTGWFVVPGASWLDATLGTYSWDTTSQRHGWYSFAARIWDGSAQGVAASPNWLHIVQPAAQMPTFTFTTPTSGQSVAHGSTFNLNWTASVPTEDTGKMKVQLWACYIDYKNGNAAVWIKIADNLDPATGTYAWNTTSLNTDYQWYSFSVWLGYDDLWVSNTSANWLHVA